ncbi:DUF4031 domain-containing protein [Ornithinimicrobium faecis]|uniref:DUF4031 domain-containing protein n=1 Tax=Ornithinimicrobium faecis TaxID=2934158 RepID=A0ABY4YVM8_9MICO|nr:DUF4031 domain-containing protein [Ornithinimicrobium sp. HY1793]USQ80785.1 DUF4031 domain-containing protein [Ornithinimicrobium sp. HY1793]
MILIDPPTWPAHGHLWSHVISDTSLEELHAFARAAGIPQRSFEGDHYDVPDERHGELVAAGAVPVGNRELARVLSASGLRFRKRKGERPLARVVDGLAAVGGPHVLDVVGSPHEPRASSGASVVLVADPADWMVLVHSVGREAWTPPGGKRDAGETPRVAAVREVAEETSLQLDPVALQPVGYERITIAEGAQRGPWDPGDNHIAVFGTRVAERLPVTPQAADVVAAEWVDRPTLVRRCDGEPWWPLVERFLSLR